MDNPRIVETASSHIPVQQQQQDAPRAGSRVVGADNAGVPRSFRADHQTGIAASNNAQSSNPTLIQRSVRALSNSAPVSTVAHSLKKSLPVSQFNQTTRFLLPDSTGQSSQLRDALQGNIVELKRSTSSPERDQLQQLAHRHLLAYADHARSFGDRVIPTLSEVFQSSMYNLVFFGLFRGAGENAASVLHQYINEQPLQLGYYADPNAPSQSGEQALIEHSMRLFISSFTGALGDMTAAHGIAPLFNAIGRQTKPIPSDVLVPDRMRDLMNQLEPGSGDALRSKVEAQEFELSSGASRTNIKIAQNIFTGFWTLKNALHPGPFGAAGNGNQVVS